MGSGVVGFNMNATHHIMNDINTHIIKFYNAIKNGTITPEIAREFLEHEGDLLKSSSNGGQDYFKSVRDRFNNSSQELDFLFLSRSCFNGMIRFNGSGKYNVPFCKKPDRFSKAYITKIVNQISYIMDIVDSSWEFTNISFEDVISKASADDIIYCDPPYMGKSSDYFSKWTNENEMKLFELLCSTKSKFVLSSWKSNSYRENEHFVKYSDKFKFKEIDHRYQVGPTNENRNSVVEVLIYNF